jgi:putative transposase
MIEYKADWYNCIIQKVDTFFASSQTCSKCGIKNPNVKDLSVRKWICECGAEHDRDLNASLNILQEGKKLLAD